MQSYCNCPNCTCDEGKKQIMLDSKSALTPEQAANRALEYLNRTFNDRLKANINRSSVTKGSDWTLGEMSCLTLWILENESRGRGNYGGPWLYTDYHGSLKVGRWANPRAWGRASASHERVWDNQNSGLKPSLGKRTLIKFRGSCFPCSGWILI